MNKIVVSFVISLTALVGLFMIAESAQASGAPVVGDADCSGSVNARDAQFVLRSSVGLPVAGGNSARTAECLSLGDADCDATLSSRDAMLILRFAVGKAVPSTGNCVIGQAVPDFEEGKDVVSEQPLLDNTGKQIGTVVVTREVAVASGISVSPSSVTAAAADYYWSCRSEVYAKNSVGMKVFTLRHYQGYRYNGSRVTVMYAPYMTSSTMPGWSMHDPSTVGPTNYGTVGTSQSSATYKYLNVPWIGSVQSYRVTAGTYVYGTGRCYPWGAW